MPRIPRAGPKVVSQHGLLGIATVYRCQLKTKPTSLTKIMPSALLAAPKDAIVYKKRSLKKS